MSFTGKAKNFFSKQLGNSWKDLADLLEIPASAQRRFDKGDEARDIWDWLEDRAELTRLPNVLQEIDRIDLAEMLRENTREIPATTAPSDTPTDDNDSDEDDPIAWIAKTFDHIRQLPPLCRSLFDSPEAAVALVDGCSDDMPEYLAHHAFLHRREDMEDISQRVTVLRDIAKRQPGPEAFWNAIYENVGSGKDPIKSEVHEWLDQHDRQLFYVPIQIKYQGTRLKSLVRDARQFLDELAAGHRGKRSGLLVLIAFKTKRQRLPWLWRLRSHLHRRRCHEGVYWLERLSHLDQDDVDDWFDNLKSHIKKCLKLGQIEQDLDALFKRRFLPIPYKHIRYKRIRDCLLREGSLRRARIHRP